MEVKIWERTEDLGEVLGVLLDVVEDDKVSLASSALHQLFTDVPNRAQYQCAQHVVVYVYLNFEENHISQRDYTHGELVIFELIRNFAIINTK